MRLFKNMRGASLALIFVVSTLCFSPSTPTKNVAGIKTRSPASETGASCVCVPYYYCDAENTMITTGEGLMDVRYSEMNPDYEQMCEDDLEVCCRLPQPVTDAPKCGIRRPGNEQLLPRLDKNAADDAEFPWMVNIFRTDLVQQKNGSIENKVYQCQGTLINERVVLTAAQCIQESGNRTARLSVRAGQTDTMMAPEESPYQEYEVRDVIVHKKYDAVKLRNNIALLVLEKSVTINRRVDITCLAHREDVIDADKCLVIGWDQFLSSEDAKMHRSQSNLLRKRLEPYLPMDTCTSILRKTPLGKRFKLDNSFICAGGLSGNNFCSREIGGPLACPLKSDPLQYVQLGIASWCINSGNLPTPGIFTSILRQRKWIDKEMGKLHIKSSAYRASGK